MKEKEALITQLSVYDVLEEHTLISEPLLSAWYNDDSFKYIPQPTVLAQALCEHKLFSPRKFHLVKCVRAEVVSFFYFYVVYRSIHLYIQYI